MREEEIGAMFKRLASMTKDRHSDYAVGSAALQFVEAAMDCVIEKQIGALSPAERMDLESWIVRGT